MSLPKPVQDLIDSGKATPDNLWKLLATWQHLFYAPEARKMGTCGPAERRLRAIKRPQDIGTVHEIGHGVIGHMTRAMYRAGMKARKVNNPRHTFFVADK